MGKYRKGGNNILQSKKREDMEEAKSTKGEGGGGVGINGKEMRSI